MWWTMLSGILGGIPGMVGDYFKKKAELANANLEYQKQLLQAQVLMAGEAARAQLEYQTAALHATTSTFKQMIYWCLFAPIFISVCFPSYAEIMWHNLSLVPPEYWTLYSAVVLTIWGIPVASNMIGRVFNGVTSYASDRRADKIQMLSVSSDQYKKALADAMRLTGNGKVDPKVWDNVSAALDKMGNTPAKAD